MTTARDHYAEHLGPIYSWMVGDLDAALARADTELGSLGLPTPADGPAVDLGAGFGLHAIPLARGGFRVIALDTCDTLLAELRRHAGELPVRALRADLLDFAAHLDAPAPVILCMGDTLTHLPDAASLDSLLDAVAAHLAPGGVFAATFRDYVSAPLQGDARFIPVRSDANRILTCFLEYGTETVTVHDILHEREGDSWRCRVSSYPKLRLAPDAVVEALAGRGLTAGREAGPAGMVRVVARRDAS